MKILVVGKTGPLSSANACAVQFQKLGCEVRQFDSNPQTSLVGPRRSGRKSAAQRWVFDQLVNRRFIADCMDFKPDIIFSQKCDTLRADAIAEAKKWSGAKYALWYGDNPFHHHVTSWNVIQSLPVTDRCYAWGEFMIESLLSAGCQRVEYLPFAFDPHFHNPEVTLVSEDEVKYKSGVCFVGSWDLERQKALEEIADLDLAIYGQNWLKFVDKSSPIHSCIRADSIWGENFVKSFKGAKVVLNLMREFNFPSHNFRTMEAAGIGGGVLLTPYSREQATRLFAPSGEIYFYDKDKGPREEVIQLLSTSDEVLSDVSRAAQKRVFAEHLLEHRLSKILSDFC